MGLRILEQNASSDVLAVVKALPAYRKYATMPPYDQPMVRAGLLSVNKPLADLLSDFVQSRKAALRVDLLSI